MCTISLAFLNAFFKPHALVKPSPNYQAYLEPNFEYISQNALQDYSLLIIRNELALYKNRNKYKLLR